jgi:secondary thiamine-phosphate synthase enzyme
MVPRTDNQTATMREGLVGVVTDFIEFSSGGDADITLITPSVRAVLARSGLRDGTVTVFAPGATAAITTIEYEPGVVSDLQDVLDAIVPPDRCWRHNVNNGDGNGHSHVRAGLLGPSLSVPFADGGLILGRWQEIVFCDFDARPRERRVAVQVMGI